MEITRWFFRDKYASGMSALRTRQQAQHQHDLAIYEEAWSNFQGKSKYEVFDLFKAATLVQISVPNHQIPWFSWYEHTDRVQAMLRGLVDFNEREGKNIIYSWLINTGENVLRLIDPSQLPLRTRIVRALANALNMFAPTGVSVLFDGKRFSEVRQENPLLNFYKKSLYIEKIHDKGFLKIHNTKYSEAILQP